MKEYVLITGAHSDIGKAVVHNLSKNNNLILHGRDSDQLEKLCFSTLNSNKHLIYNFDFDEIDNLSDSFINFLERNNAVVKSVIHIAGVFDVIPVKMVHHKMMQKSFNVNLYSLVDIVQVLLSKKYSPYLTNIIAVSTVSLHTLYGRGHLAYLSSKSALEAYMRGLAGELAPKMRVNVIAAGRINTSSLSIMPEETIVKLKKQHPLGFGEPDDISNMVDYLLSENGKWITGQVFIIDGGNSCRLI